MFLSLCSHFLSTSNVNDDSLEMSVNNFFIQLFPVAYLHGINSEQSIGVAKNGDRLSHQQQHSKQQKDQTLVDFHTDYKNCLSQMYEQFQPFGNIPKQLSKNIVQSVSTAGVFLRGLQGGADVIGGVESLDVTQLNHNCKEALVKMSFCASCKGHSHSHAKPCYGYCMNVMRFVS